jgi:hypothetical protein
MMKMKRGYKVTQRLVNCKKHLPFLELRGERGKMVLKIVYKDKEESPLVGTGTIERWL